MGLMKFGVRKPSIQKMLKARTTSKWKRGLKRAINPFYGKRGTGFMKSPKRAMGNRIYRKTTFDIFKIFKTIIIVTLFLGSAQYTYASSGLVRTDSIIECGGVKYGQHSTDNHWHQARWDDDSRRWHAIGEPLAGKPCEPQQPAPQTSPGNAAPATSSPPTSSQPTMEQAPTVISKPSQPAASQPVATNPVEPSATEDIDPLPKDRAEQEQAPQDNTEPTQVSENPTEIGASINPTKTDPVSGLIGLAVMGGGGYGIYRLVKRKGSS